MASLIKGEKSAHDLAKPFAMSLPGVSKHLRVLENAKLVKRKIEGRNHLFTVQARQIHTASKWVSMFEIFWNEKLDNLEIFLNKEK